MLVEIDGSWGEHAFLQSRINTDIGRAIVRRAEAAGLRPVAIRRFGRRADERRASSGHRWAIADARQGRISMRWGSVDDPAELLEIPLDGSTGHPTTEPAYLVCTHARHDRCCAVRGRPVAQALAHADPENTWECSHLGGDRFATTMIVLPHGLCYGRVPAERAHEILTATREGRIVRDLFRGRSSLPNVIQAAQAFARQELDEDHIDTLPPLPDAIHQTGSQWTVALAHAHQTVRVRLNEDWSQPLLSTCAARIAAPVRTYEPVSLHFTSPPGQ
nr:sucrase ferredoxin [Brachybacterium halotolerans]